MDLMVGEKGAREASAASKDPKLSSPFTWRKFFEQPRAFKATLSRTCRGAVVCSGGFMEDTRACLTAIYAIIEAEIERRIDQMLREAESKGI
jgi:hypothetical protein